MKRCPISGTKTHVDKKSQDFTTSTKTHVDKNPFSPNIQINCDLGASKRTHETKKKDFGTSTLKTIIDMGLSTIANPSKGSICDGETEVVIKPSAFDENHISSIGRFFFFFFLSQFQSQTGVSGRFPHGSFYYLLAVAMEAANLRQREEAAMKIGGLM